MTYLEKVMQRIKLDKELLTEEQAEKLKEGRNAACHRG